MSATVADQPRHTGSGDGLTSPHTVGVIMRLTPAEADVIGRLFTPGELLALRKTVNLVARAADRYDDHDPIFVAYLAALEEKLEHLAEHHHPICRHCHQAPRRSSDGLCRACDNYRRENARRRNLPASDGRLPSPSLLARRQAKTADTSQVLGLAS